MKSRIAIVATAMLLLFTLTACEGQPIPAADTEDSTTTTAESAAETTAETVTATSIPAEEQASEDSETVTDAETETTAEGDAIILRPTPAAVQEDPTPEPVAETVDWTSTASIEGDYYVRGNPNAPIRLIDYSDFL